MKKIAVAVAAALTAGSAMAAEVTLYGIVDTGLAYIHSDVGGQSSSSFSMESGVTAGSRFGLKGTEDLGNGWSVSFNLQNGFSNDDGKFASDGVLFNREAILSVHGPYGTLSAGRMGALTSGLGTYDIFQYGADVLDGGYIASFTGYWAPRDRYNNTLTYVTPEANGFAGYLQYSNGTDTETGSSRGQDRYAAVGMTYAVGNLNFVAVVDTVLKGNDENGERDQDTKAVSVGANYNFGKVKAFAGFQYGKDERSFGDYEFAGVDDAKVDGYTAHLGATWTVPCGALNTAVYYGQYDINNVKAKAEEADVLGVMVSHVRPFSKRTYLYTALGLKKTSFEGDCDDREVITAAVGLNHTF